MLRLRGRKTSDGRYAHADVHSAHQLGLKLHDRPQMHGLLLVYHGTTCINFAKRSDMCQFHANFIH